MSHDTEDDAYRRGFDYGCKEMREACLVKLNYCLSRPKGTFQDINHALNYAVAAIRALELPGAQDGFHRRVRSSDE